MQRSFRSVSTWVEMLDMEFNAEGAETTERTEATKLVGPPERPLVAMLLGTAIPTG